MKNTKAITQYLAAKKAAQLSNAEPCPIAHRKAIIKSKIEAIKSKGELSPSDKEHVRKLREKLFLNHNDPRNHNKGSFNNRLELPMYKRRSNKYAYVSDALAAKKGIL